jgi:hypothetical protein
MNLLIDLYRNKAKDLQEHLFILERELKSLDESIVSSTTETLTDPLTVGTIGGLMIWDRATKSFQPSYPKPTSFIGQAQHEFTNFPVARGTLEMGKQAAKAVASPIQSSKAIGQAAKQAVSGAAKGVQQAVQSPAEAAKAAAKATATTAKNLAMLGTGVVAPLAAGHVTGELASKGLEMTGIDALKPSEPGEFPGAGDIIPGAADWAAMQATGQALGNLFAGRALGTGVAAAAGLGAIGGALAPVAMYGGLKGAEAIRGIKLDDETTVGDWLDQQFTDVANYAYGGEETYAKNPDIEKIYDKYEKMKSKAEKDIEKKSQEAAILPPY